MRKCCVPGCHSNYGKPYVPTFLFPKDNERRKLWETNIGRQGIKVTNNIGVCIKHFAKQFIIRQDSFVDDNMEVISQARKKVKLKPGACPTIFGTSSLSDSYNQLITSEEESSKGMQMKRAKLKKEALPSLNLPYSSERTMGTNVAKKPVLLQKLLKKTSTTNRPIITVVKAEGISTGEPGSDDHSEEFNDDDEIQIIKHEKAPNKELRHSYENSQNVSVGLKQENRNFTHKEKTTLKRRTSSVGSNSSDGSNETFKSSVSVAKRKKPDKPLVTGRKNDCYCWVCHKEGIILSCIACPRAYHHRCAGELDYSSDWVCPECRRITTAENVDTRTQTLSEISLDKFCALLKSSVNKLKGRAPAAFHQPVPVEYYSSYLFYVIHPMDLSLIEKNIKLKAYGCTESFLADVKWILHNSCVFNGAQHPLTASARTLVKSCEYDMGEIEVCPDCFLHSCTRSKYWFSDVCRKPHSLVWAKLKGFPYWPAKVARMLDGNVDARFFGAHDRAWVPMSQCYHLSKEMPTSSKPKKKGTYETALDELNVHVHLLMQKYGKFEYAPYRTLFDPDNKVFMFHGIEIDKISSKEDIAYEPSLSVKNDVPVTSAITSKSPSYQYTASSENNIPCDSSHSFEMLSLSMKTSLNSHSVSPSLSPSHDNDSDILSVEKIKVENKPVPSGIFEVSKAINFDAPKNLELNSALLVTKRSNSNVENLKKLESAIERIKEFIDDGANASEEKNNESEIEDNKSKDVDLQNAVKQCFVEQSKSRSDSESSKQAAKETTEICITQANELPIVSPNKTESSVPITLSKKTDYFALKLGKTIESCKAKLGITEISAEDAESLGSESCEEDECEKGIESSSSEAEAEQSAVSSSSDEEDSDEDAKSNSSGTDVEIIEKAEKNNQSASIKLETTDADTKLIGQNLTDENKCEKSVIDIIELGSSDSDSDDKIILEDKIFVDISKIAVQKDFAETKNNGLTRNTTKFSHEEMHSNSPVSVFPHDNSMEKMNNAETCSQKAKNNSLMNDVSLKSLLSPEVNNMLFLENSPIKCSAESDNLRDSNNLTHKTLKDSEPIKCSDIVSIIQSHDDDNDNKKFQIDKIASNNNEKNFIEPRKMCLETHSELPISSLTLEQKPKHKPETCQKEMNDYSPAISSGSDFLKDSDILKDSSDGVWNTLPVDQSSAKTKPTNYLDSKESTLDETSALKLPNNSSLSGINCFRMCTDFLSTDSEVVAKSHVNDDPLPSTSQCEATISDGKGLSPPKETESELPSLMEIDEDQETKEKEAIPEDFQFDSAIPSINSDENSMHLKDVSDLPNDVETLKKHLCAIQGELKLMKSKIKRQEWYHEQEMNELRHNMNLIAMEMRASLEANKKEAIEDLCEQHLLEKVKSVEEAKRKQWCANCRLEAMFHCCWNTSYCSHSCQKHHWPKHRHTCVQMKSSLPIKPTPIDFVKIAKKPNANSPEVAEINNSEKKVILLNVKPSEIIPSTIVPQASSTPNPSVETLSISQPQTQLTAPNIQFITSKNQLQLVTTAPSQSQSSVPLQFLPNSPVQLVLTPVNPSSEQAVSQTPLAPKVTQDSAEIITKVRSRQTDYNTAIHLLNMMNKETAATYKIQEATPEDNTEEFFISLPKSDTELLSLCAINVDTDNKPNFDSSQAVDVSLDDDVPMQMDDCNEDTEREMVSIGNGVEIKATILNRCLTYSTTATKLVRCLMDVLFPSTETLANSSVFGRKSNLTKETKPALPPKLVNAIIDFVSKKFEFTSRKEIVLAMNLKCKEARRALFRCKQVSGSPKKIRMKKSSENQDVCTTSESSMSSVLSRSGLPFGSISDSSASQSLALLSRLVTPTVKTVSSAVQVVSPSKTIASSEAVTRLIGVPRILQCVPSNKPKITTKPHFVLTDKTLGVSLPQPLQNSLSVYPATSVTQSTPGMPIITTVDRVANVQTIMCSVTNSSDVKHLNTLSNSNLCVQTNAISQPVMSLQNLAVARNTQPFIILGSPVSTVPK